MYSWREACNKCLAVFSSFSDRSNFFERLLSGKFKVQHSSSAAALLSRNSFHGLWAQAAAPGCTSENWRRKAPVTLLCMSTTQNLRNDLQVLLNPSTGSPPCFCGSYKGHPLPSGRRHCKRVWGVFLAAAESQSKRLSVWDAAGLPAQPAYSTGTLGSALTTHCASWHVSHTASTTTQDQAPESLPQTMAVASYLVPCLCSSLTQRFIHTRKGD